MRLSVISLLRLLVVLVSGVNADWKSDVVGKVNSLRAAHGAPPVAWDATLESYATKWVTHLANQNTGLEHSDGKYGENLAAYGGGCPGGPNNCTWASIDLWYAEGANYDYTASFQSRALHFTQVVWASTKKIGAAAFVSTKKPKWFYIVMEFDPPGNYAGQFISNVFPLTSTLSLPSPSPSPPSPKPSPSPPSPSPSPPKPSPPYPPHSKSSPPPPPAQLPFPQPVNITNSATLTITNTNSIYALVAATLFVVAALNPLIPPVPM